MTKNNNKNYEKLMISALASSSLANYSEIFKQNSASIKAMGKALNSHSIAVSQLSSTLAQIALPSYIKGHQDLIKKVSGIMPANLLLQSKAMQLALPKINPSISLSTEIIRKAMGSLNISSIHNQMQFMQEVMERSRVSSVLLKQYWLVIDKELFEIISTASKSANFDVNECIIKYYSENKYKNIENILSYIAELNCCEHRMHIIDSCFRIMKSSAKKHIYNIVIPVLAAQMTGLIEEDCYKAIPKTKKEEIKKILQENKKESGSNYTKIEIIDEYLKHSIGAGKYIEFNTVIKNKSFCNGGKIEKLSDCEIEKYNKFRPKILHGDSKFLDYGTKENLIRSWLELAFIAKILEIICMKQIGE